MNSFIDRDTVWRIGKVILDICVLTLVLSWTTADPDLWGHLRFGLDIIQTGTIIQIDPYSYVTTGVRWINHEWLAEVLFALAWTAGRAPGLILLKMIVEFLTFGLLYRHLRAMQLRHIQATILLLLMGSLLAVVFSSNVRPQLFTFLCFTLILLIIRRAELGAYRRLWAAPLLLMVWTNLHGGFLAGLGLLCLWAPMYLVVNRRTWVHIIPPILVCIAAPFVNPYGIDLLTFLLRTATVPRPEITEWQPLLLISIPGLLYLLVLLVAVGGIIRSTQPRRPILLILFGVTALLPWIAVRHLSLFSIASLILTGEHVGSAWNRIWPYRHTDNPVSPWLAGIPLVMAAALMILGSTRELHRIHMADEQQPIAAVALLKQSGVSGHLATHFNWGEYIIWHLGPHIKVSMDGRRETIYSTAIYQQYQDLYSGVKDWDALLRQYRTDLALVYKESAIYNLLTLTPDWMMLYEDSKSVLFVNRRSSLVAPLKQAVAEFTPPETAKYFP